MNSEICDKTLIFEGNRSSYQQASMPVLTLYWAYLPSTANAKFIGSGTPLDAGDFKGDGHSHVLFIEAPVDIPSRVKVTLFSEDFDTFETANFVFMMG